ncbi:MULTISPECIES: hypothetical protein [Sphingomonadales]|uniref:Conjugal transfer protein TraN n=3 Tax=Sphingomonadaceae TaxID=41297 RepID=A0A0S3F130_9SPHN|nr:MULTISPECIES: hypothetical protein [Sphingomonadaceae]ALR21350.1 hypothetical protein ATN00_14690 [Sphingobium baderi]AMG73067.1 Uncharacterized protein SGRAN_0671 [Sphingopyxis granuli]QUT05343.1 hypothetical protein KFK14_20525 [Sphingobium phenoxybenzoativorans]
MVRRGIFLLAATALMASPVSAQTVEDRARAAAEVSRAKTSDSDAIQQNYLTPGLAGQPISTVDNSQTFNPNIACQKTATLLELIAQPAATGDIGTLRISRDKDLDGTVDQTLTLPVPVSGICANGVVSCQPGTWNQCKSFKWDVASGGDLKLAQVELTDLAGCYCVNNSCGSNLVWGNMASVLKDLGGGVIGALTTADPRVGVAQAVIDGPAIRYTGAQSTACSPDPALPQTAYRASPATIQGDAASVAASNSIFQALKASPAGVGKADQIRSCTITREISIKPWQFDDIVSASGGITSSWSCGDGCRRYQIRGAGACGSNPPVYSAIFSTQAPERITSARIVEMGADDWVQARVNGVAVGYAGKRVWMHDGIPSGDCRISGSAWYNHAPIDITTQLKAGAATVSARVRGGGGGNWGYVVVEIQADTACDVSERIIDLCSGYAGDANCALHDENVDGVDTFRSGVGTGLTPLPQTRLFESGACSLRLARPWFERQRRYRCTVDTGSMPEPDLGRGAWIIDHSTETMLADRVRTADGGYSTSSRSFALPDRGSVPACEPVCKTRAPARNTAAAIDGVVGAKQNAPVGWDTFYHACTAASGGDVCPVGPGEEIVSPCGCLDDFPEAVVMMQTVRLGGADMVCTGEVR